MMNVFPSLKFMMLSHPQMLWLLIPVILLLVVELRNRAPGAIAISTGDVLANIKNVESALTRRVPAIFRALGLALLVLALARPMQGLEVRRDKAEVIDVMLCVDVSGSMRAMDFVAEGKRHDRLYVTKEAVRDFIRSRKDRLAGRYGTDRLGLILYASYAWTQCPLTLDYGVLERELNQASIDLDDPNKQGTAIGSALGLAVKRLSDSDAKSKIIILLTDGLNNAGELDPLTAARIAKDYGIKIYTIGAGSKGEALIPVRTPFGERMRSVNIPIDEDSLTKIATITGGRYYRASDTESLQAAYREINELETTVIDVDDYYEYKEGFVPYALLGALLVMASILSRRLWFEPIP